jgi:choline dehydrogenase-like flavoprotein
MAHVATQVWGTFEQETRPNKGYPSSLITEDLVRPRDADFAGGYLLQSLGVVLGTWAETVTRSRSLWGPPLLSYLDAYNHVAGLGINGECLPQADNRLELSDERDPMGIPKARIHFSRGANETAMSQHAERTMRDLWNAVGARDVWVAQRSAHTIGTCRMGESADTAVVDATGRSFDIPNVWICDNSVFPSSLAANPALTIMALGLRTADAFLRHRDGVPVDN